jgi:hypothetical protein
MSSLKVYNQAPFPSSSGYHNPSHPNDLIQQVETQRDEVMQK